MLHLITCHGRIMPRLAELLLRHGQICVPIHLYWENVEKSFSQNILKTNG